ncbi:MAG: aminomethyl-transferring glycine dehydrogenase subunit GcvPB [Proteobacteria bacterium]|nr:aminomethyl-transferring glycine dehydrogenase subunit GcvPB [Pseudomonadota bacterium]MBU1585056.1 aminomethyl-transferring glycine dehydrogenase subunit GcvPB [Pseudomonadota bacterium]MBU2456014.1 aminomethyl-transferring glycine dehydrogenase subunit GcvPB [Pseudomonadota bacterium]MBU2627356.1 aminomethyl-transferring glycine dehydrogenase subunit GcvPB [Pseudomonadota bacterium]
MDKQDTINTRQFHQAKWDEPIIFELSEPGKKGIISPRTDLKILEERGNAFDTFPGKLKRKTPPDLPELGQMEVVKHYLRLSQENLGADLNVDIGQGTCTMKYNPKINDKIAGSEKIMKVHPYQDEQTLQGILQILFDMNLYFRQISGLDRFSFQPASGSHAILGMASIVRAYHQKNTSEKIRDEIITTIFSHPSDAAAAKTIGYKIITLFPDENGYPDVDALKAAVSDKTAALFITNPEDTGIYNPKIREFTRLVHDNGGLCCYDQANANGLLGIARAREAGFDICFFNLHKTFGTPHGCGGPGAGALGVIKPLERFLPSPLVEKTNDQYALNWNLPDSIGKIRQFYGTIPAIVKAYAWIRALGAEGLKKVSQTAVLNNNYMMKKILEIKGVSAPFAPGRIRIEQVRFSFEKLYEDTGVTFEDIQARMADFGFHIWSSHHPHIVKQPFTIEPTESYSKLELDEYLAGLQKISKEAYETPEILKTAPHNSVTRRPGHKTLDDPLKWAVTWRAYLKKCNAGQRLRIR